MGAVTGHKVVVKITKPAGQKEKKSRKVKLLK